MSDNKPSSAPVKKDEKAGTQPEGEKKLSKNQLKKLAKGKVGWNINTTLLDCLRLFALKICFGFYREK